MALSTLASIILIDGSMLTGRLIEHRGAGVVVILAHGRRYAGELAEHHDRRLRALADLIEHTPGGISV